jgi:uncharacterized UPF0160 family protein
MRKLDKRSQIVGKVFDGVKVVSVTDKLKWKARVFKAICRCGKEFEECGYILKKGYGCGCKINNQGRKTEEHDQERFLKTKFSTYKSGAKSRGLDFTFTFKVFKYFVERDCYYCGQPPIESTVNKGKSYKYTGKANGIDRKDNGKGYSFLNCVTCCTTCNMMKKDLPHDDFVEQCHKVSIKSLEKIAKGIKK